MDLYLRIAPELYLKRLVTGGFERVFEINRNFRNEGISTQHNPEFTMLEFYQAYATYEDLMALTEEMFQQASLHVTGSVEVQYQGQRIDFASPWKQMTLYVALESIAGIDPAMFDQTGKADGVCRCQTGLLLVISMKCRPCPGQNINQTI